MEAASRPPPETLPDLPVEAPLGSAKARSATGAASGGPSTAVAEAAKPRDPEQTGLNFVDPEMFLGPGQLATAVPVLNAATPPGKTEPELELVLEDPVVDDMLTAPPPPPSPAAAPPTAAASAAPKATSPEPAADTAAARAAARVPIAKTASLSSAATKLAAASGVSRPGAKPAPPPKPQTAPPPAQPSNGETAKAPVPVAKASAATAPKTDTPSATLDAPSLASWASARAAAAQKARPAAAPTSGASSNSQGAATATKSSAARGASSAPSPPATATATVTPPPSSASSVPAAPTMDRDFIARNQVVERYLSGRLPLKAATEFERYCRAHAELLDELGLPERVNAGLRLLEASGKPEPWQEAPRPIWQKPQVTLALAVGVAVLAMTLAGMAASNSSKSHRIEELQKQNTERALDPATNTREIRLLPSRSGASNSAAITIGGGAGGAQLADLKIDESRSPFHTFRITIDRIDQGRVAIINNIDKDSNGHLRIALNSSALGPGNYQLTLEGLDWRGQPQPDSWVTIGIAR
jgi:hypothetical protein